MKLVYIAGPYRASNHWLIEVNIYRARALGALVAQMGGVPLIPHANTAHWDGLCPDDFWLDAGIEMLRRCDGVALVDGWKDSQGTLAEIAEADRLGMPVFPPSTRQQQQSAFPWADLLRGWLQGELTDDEAASYLTYLGRGR